MAKSNVLSFTLRSSVVRALKRTGPAALAALDQLVTIHPDKSFSYVLSEAEAIQNAAGGIAPVKKATKTPPAKKDIATLSGLLMHTPTPKKVVSKKVTSKKENGKAKQTAATPANVSIPMTRESTIKSPCLIVWDMADAMKGARRKDVIAACVKKGVAFYTARTQYQHWFVSKNNDAKN